jgi:hypothetical protein
VATSIQFERANRGLSSALVAADTSIEVALEPVKLCQGIRKRCRDVGSRFAVQPVHVN